MPEIGLVCAMKIGEADYILPVISVGDVTKMASVTQRRHHFRFSFQQYSQRDGVYPHFSMLIKE